MNKFSFIAYIFAVTLFMACSDSGTDNGNAEQQSEEQPGQGQPDAAKQDPDYIHDD